jgi:hypothetical protein
VSRCRLAPARPMAPSELWASRRVEVLEGEVGCPSAGWQSGQGSSSLPAERSGNLTAVAADLRIVASKPQVAVTSSAPSTQSGNLVSGRREGSEIEQPLLILYSADRVRALEEPEITPDADVKRGWVRCTLVRSQGYSDWKVSIEGLEE